MKRRVAAIAVRRRLSASLKAGKLAEKTGKLLQDPAMGFHPQRLYLWPQEILLSPGGSP
jgi:hypothetical protein